MPHAVAVSATYFTDPFCPRSWGAEPRLRRLQAVFGVEVRYVMTGLGRQIEPARAAELALQTLDAVAETGMPADARVWLRDPPKSTYPAAIAVHAVAEQGDPGPFIRRLREAVFLEGRRLGDPESLLTAAREAGVGNLERLRVDFGSNAMLENFGADLERTREEGVTSHTLQIGDTWAQDDWDAAARGAGAEEADSLSVEDALARFGSMATAEVAAVCGLPYARASGELWRLAMEWRVTPRRVPGGELWVPAR